MSEHDDDLPEGEGDELPGRNIGDPDDEDDAVPFGVDEDEDEPLPWEEDAASEEELETHLIYLATKDPCPDCGSKLESRKRDGMAEVYCESCGYNCLA